MSDLIDKVSAMLGLTRSACLSIAISAPKRYKVFDIPKRNGKGVRTIAQPAREVKAIQRALVTILGDRLPVHRAATAYKQGASILGNALPHADAKFITKMDLQGFFPSIDRTSLGRHLRSCLKDFASDEVGFVLSACLWKAKGTTTHRLCIGAPSSPLLSNSIMYPIDADIAEMCDQVGVVYTRYSDDICISSKQPDVLWELEQKIRRRIEASRWPTLRLNEEKRVAVGRGVAMTVTGLTLSNEGVLTVGRQRKRGVRAGALRYLKGLLDPTEIAKLKGEIAFVLSVERGFRFVLLKTYGDEIRPLLPRLFG